MAHAAGDAHEYPVYGAHFRLVFPLLDADGDLVSGAATPDSERSIDCGTFADCTNEMTEIATTSGMYYLDLTGAEMTGKVITVIAKSATVGMKTTPIVLYPRRLPIMESGVAQAGAAGTITLAAGASSVDNFYNGLFVHITDNDAAGSQYQLRRIVSYVGSTRVATIDSAWGTNPSSASNYDILIPEGYSTAAWAGTKVPDSTTIGTPDVNVLRAANVAWASGAITAAVIATGAIDADAVATDAVTEIQSGLATSASISALNNVSAAQVNAEVVDALNTDTYAEPGQATPGATVSLAAKINYLYKAWRNRHTATATQYTLYNDDGTTVAQKAVLSDDATTFDRGEIETGP